MSFDEAVLDDEQGLARLDQGRLLWSLATAGAQVRRAVETAAEFGVDRLRGDAPPRALLVATDVPDADSLLVALSATVTAPVAWVSAELPRWAGPADALLVASLDGHSQWLARLAAQGAQRGLAMAVAAPAAGEVSAAVAGRAPVCELPRDVHPQAARWSVLTPLLQALDALGVAQVAQGLLIEIADALDQQAELCRPSGETFTNAAKSLAVEFAESVPVVAGAGALATVAARTIAGSLASFAGVVACAASLPSDFARAASVVRGTDDAGGDVDDFFRDRVDDVATRPRARLLVLGDDGAPDDPLLGDRSRTAVQFDEMSARRAAQGLRDLASDRGVRSSSVDVPPGDPLARFAAATAFGDFVAAYLAFGLGADPSRPAWLGGSDE